MQIILSQLEEVELREVWPNEAQDFTTWLAEPENLRHLGKTLDMKLERAEKEVNVGNFRVDILCQDDADGSRVIIENQLEQTNHKHLGQLLTYSVGLDAHTVIWIAKKFREEHRAVLDQLNKITDENFQYFGIEIQVSKIENSTYLPQFEIVSKPNNWSRKTEQALQESLHPTRERNLRFWTQFVEYLDTNDIFPPPNPSSYHFVSFPTGKKGFTLYAEIRSSLVRVRLVMSRQEHFDTLHEQRTNIESAFGEDLIWKRLPDQDSSWIALENRADPKNEDDWQNQHKWLGCKIKKFDKVFKPKVIAPPALSDDE